MALDLQQRHGREHASRRELAAVDDVVDVLWPVRKLLHNGTLIGGKAFHDLLYVNISFVFRLVNAFYVVIFRQSASRCHDFGL